MNLECTNEMPQPMIALVGLLVPLIALTSGVYLEVKGIGEPLYRHGVVGAAILLLVQAVIQIYTAMDLGWLKTEIDTLTDIYAYNFKVLKAAVPHATNLNIYQTHLATHKKLDGGMNPPASQTSPPPVHPVHQKKKEEMKKK
jgi:hypothetical protein